MKSFWRTLVVLLVVTLFLAGGAWWGMGRGPDPSGASRVRGEGSEAPESSPPLAESTRTADRPEVVVDGKDRASKADRDELYRRIVESLAKRHSVSDDPGAPAPPGPALDDDAPPEPGSIKNRMGDLDGWGPAMTELLNEDLAPLTDECFEAALERTPDIGRYVEIEFTVVADEEIGGVVESAEMGARNEALEPEFIQCVRESTLSTVFPPPPGSGRQGVMLSLRFDE